MSTIEDEYDITFVIKLIQPRFFNHCTDFHPEYCIEGHSTPVTTVCPQARLHSRVDGAASVNRHYHFLDARASLTVDADTDVDPCSWAGNHKVLKNLSWVHGVRVDVGRVVRMSKKEVASDTD